MADEQPKCPVDHSTRQAWIDKTSKKPEPAPEQPKCPVDHDSRAEWASKVTVTTTSAVEAIESDGCTSNALTDKYSPSDASVNLPNDREISSIPRTEADSNWIYPSQRQFFDAMKRKNWNPEAEDMKTVVPIHNAVNERAWHQILLWEHPYHEETMKKCGGITLSSFKGDLKKLTPRAWFNSTILGYEKPFDRHDWIINRCGVEVPYVIDFYGGNGSNISFYLDVRPKVNTWEGLKLRLSRAFGL